MHKRTLKVRLPIGKEKCGKCPWKPWHGTTTCVFWTTILDAHLLLCTGVRKDASCDVGEPDGELYRCPACKAAEK